MLIQAHQPADRAGIWVERLQQGGGEAVGDGSGTQMPDQPARIAHVSRLAGAHPDGPLCGTALHPGIIAHPEETADPLTAIDRHIGVTVDGFIGMAEPVVPGRADQPAHIGYTGDTAFYRTVVQPSHEAAGQPADRAFPGDVHILQMQVLDHRAAPGAPEQAGGQRHFVEWAGSRAGEGQIGDRMPVPFEYCVERAGFREQGEGEAADWLDVDTGHVEVGFQTEGLPQVAAVARVDHPGKADKLFRRADGSERFIHPGFCRAVLPVPFRAGGKGIDQLGKVKITGFPRRSDRDAAVREDLASGDQQVIGWTQLGQCADGAAVDFPGIAGQGRGGFRDMHPAGFFLDRVKGIVIGKIGVRIERADLGESKQRCSSLFDLRAGEDAPVVPRIILNAVGMFPILRNQTMDRQADNKVVGKLAWMGKRHPAGDRLIWQDVGFKQFLRGLLVHLSGRFLRWRGRIGSIRGSGSGGPGAAGG